MKSSLVLLISLFFVPAIATFIHIKIKGKKNNSIMDYAPLYAIYVVVLLLVTFYLTEFLDLIGKVEIDFYGVLYTLVASVVAVFMGVIAGIISKQCSFKIDVSEKEAE